MVDQTIDESVLQGVVSTAWLSTEINNNETSLRVIDATYFLADKTRDAVAEYRGEHIPRAQHFDVTQVADTSSPWPSTVPHAAQFEQAVRNLGVNNNDIVIAYDRLGLFSAARVWWLFQYFGHQHVAVLDGGLPKWLAEGLPVEASPVSYPAGNFVANVQPQLLHTADHVLGIVNNPASTTQIVDARAAGRFAGTTPEPRAGLRAGHIPGSINLPYNTLLNSDNTFKAKEQLVATFDEAGVNVGEPIVTSCGSGVTACIVSLGLAQICDAPVALFDGSWTEWGSTEGLPIATLTGS